MFSERKLIVLFPSGGGGNKIKLIFRRVFSAEKIEPNDVMFSAPREPPRKATGFQSWGDRDETTEHFFQQKKSGGVGFSLFQSVLRKECLD